MEAKTELTAMECIEKIYLFSQDSHLRTPLFEAVPEEIKFLSEYLNTSEIETILFANAFAVWYNDSTFIHFPRVTIKIRRSRAPQRYTL